MKKFEYIEMLIQENTDENKKFLYDDVIDCVDIALSQEDENFEITDTSLGLSQLFEMIEKTARSNRKNCVGPFETAEIFAKALGAKFVRASMRFSTKDSTDNKKVFDIEDLI